MSLHITTIDRVERSGESFRIEGRAANQPLSLTLAADDALELAISILGEFVADEPRCRAAWQQLVDVTPPGGLPQPPSEN
jgi:hypothetical protein